MNTSERIFLLEQMENLLKEYNYKYDEDALNAIIDEWANQKQDLIEAFKKHPNYIGNFMIAYDVNYERVVDKDVLYDFSRYIMNRVHEICDDIPEEVQEVRRQQGCTCLPHETWYFLKGLAQDTYAQRTISEEVAEFLNQEVPAIHAHAGQRKFCVPRLL